MQRLIPEKTKVHIELFRGVTIGDIVVAGVGLLLLFFTLISNLPFRYIICLVIIALTVLMVVRLDEQPNYLYFLHILTFLGYKRHFAKEKGKGARPMKEILAFTGIHDDCIEYLGGQYYGAALEISPVEFRFYSELRRNNAIENCFGRILRSLPPDLSANIVKIERPIIYDGYRDREYEKLQHLSESYENGVFTEEELKARVEIEYDRINELIDYNETNRIVDGFYYLVLYEADRRQLEQSIRAAAQAMQQGDVPTHRLNDKELAIFLKYTNSIDFDEREADDLTNEELVAWAQPDTVDMRVRRVDVNGIQTHNLRVVNYPTTVGDAWLAGVMSIPGTKVVVKCRPMDRTKAIRNIDRSLTELRGQWSDTGVDSRRMEIETHIGTLQELLGTLQSESESLLETDIYITAYDIIATNNATKGEPRPSILPLMPDMKKNVRRTWQESGFRLNNCEFDQVEAFIGSQVNARDPMVKDGRGISSNTVAACFPWIYAHISDEGGVKLGESDGIPVFIDFFRRDSERVNSNMVIVGKSGSGKSYATKSLLANLAAEDARIFILDPENEYTELARNLHGQIINVGNAQYGRLNPFHIITALDDDEAGEGGPAGSYATHLQFLEEFFRQIMPDCDKDAMEYLNTLIDHMYLEHNITPETDLSRLRPEDYPIFDDVYDEVLQEFQSSDNPFTRDLLSNLMNYVAKFSTGGRNANIWNGPSTITTDENFTVFNFQSMLANRNQTIANAQMLLVLKYIDNEIIKNRDYNLKYHANRKIVVVIDEAHVFIDSKFPIALDFMFQLAKRIRKYNGMQIVITQNIKDFVGSDELARKSTAIINACQYSFIFALAPNDMQDLVTLYANAGGINESEQEQIVQAPRGQAFTIMSPTSRSTFEVRTAPGIAEMFENNDYVSRYFSGERGNDNWEDFVGDSRAAHEEAVANRPSETWAAARAISAPADTGVTLNVFDEDEYDAYLREQESERAASVTLMEMDEEPEETKAEAITQTPARAAGSAGLSAEGLAPAADAASMQVFASIANALGRMADAAERGGENPLARAAAPAVQTASAAPADENRVSFTAPAPESKDDAIARLREEMEEQLRQLREENERLRAGLTAAQAAPEPAAFTVEEPETETAEDDFILQDPLAVDDTDSLDDEEFGGEEEGELSLLFGGDSLEGTDFDFDDEDEEDDWDSDEEEDEEDEDEEDGEDEEESEDDEEGDDDFMASFCSFAASLMNMSPFEKMRANGSDIQEMTLDDLIAEAAAQQERRRKERAGEWNS